MNSIADRGYNREIKVLNQLFAAQTMLHIFPDELKMIEFITQTLNTVPGIKECIFCARNCESIPNQQSPEIQTIVEYLRNIPDNQEHFAIKLPSKKDLLIFLLQTTERSYGYICVYRESSGIFENFHAAINNFINMVALTLENHRQKTQLIKHQFHLEGLVEKRTEELQEEITERKQAKEKLNKSNRLYATLSQIGLAIAREQNIQSLFQKICDLAIEFGKFRLAWIGFIDGRTKIVKPVAYSGEGAEYLENIKISIADDSTAKGPTGKSIIEGRSVVFSDLENNPDYAPWRLQAIEKGYRSSAAFPIRLNDKVIGALNVYAIEPFFFDDEEIELLEKAAMNISFALAKFKEEEQRKQAEQEMKRSNDRLEVLHKLDNAILETQSVERIMHVTLQRLGKLSLAKRTSIALFDGLGKEAIIYSRGIFEKVLGQAKKVSLNDLFLDVKGMQKGNVIERKNLNTINSLTNKMMQMREKGVLSTFTVPILAKGKLLGSINFGFDKPDGYSNKDIELGKEIADTLAIALEQARLHDSLKQHALELEERIAERTSQLEHSNSELRDFAQIVSHDLKAPLRAISQLSFWISQDYVDKIDEEGQKQLEMLIGRVKRLDKLIDGILQYSRAGKVREKEKDINLHSLVEEVIILLDPPPTIKIIIENQLPECIGDPTRMGQLFQNLIDNAIKYMDKPQGLIKIGCRKDAGFWEFYVSDNGPGIEEIYFERIFQIFQRLVARDDMEGTGVGLSLVKRIVKIYGGDIWLTSNPGEGTTFYFTLPMI